MYKLKMRPEDFYVREELEPCLDKEGDFAYFKLKKRGIGTEEVIHAIETICKFPRRFINYSGLKDKHAVTEQIISVRQEFMKRIQGLKLKDITFEYIGLGKERIAMGQHKSNYFEVTVRNIDSKPKPVSSIPNYFDEQRFSKDNALIGKLLITKKFEEVAKLLSQKDFEIERKVRGALENKPDNPVMAIKQVPKRILMLYIHAYQSKMFNQMVAKHIENSGVDYSMVKYSQGALLFPEERIENIQLPLIGFGTVLTEVSKAVLEEEGIQTRDFILRSLPELSSEGVTRGALMDIQKLEIGKLQSDELNPDKYKSKISFSLPSGSYATMVIRALMS